MSALAGPGRAPPPYSHTTRTSSGWLSKRLVIHVPYVGRGVAVRVRVACEQPQTVEGFFIGNGRFADLVVRPVYIPLVVLYSKVTFGVAVFAVEVTSLVALAQQGRR
jgi:hypothetical protein